MGITANEEEPPELPDDFTPPEVTTFPRGGVAEAFTKRLGSYSNVTGLYLPSDNRVFISPRDGLHHPEMLTELLNGEGYSPEELDGIVSWATASYQETRYLDVPSTGEGMMQAIRERGLSDLMSYRHVTVEEPWHFYPVAWAARLTGYPGDTEVSFSTDGAMDDRTNRVLSLMDDNVRTDARFPLGDAYDRLRFSSYGLPEPILDRSGGGD